MAYPETITPEVLAKVAHLDDAEIQRDLQDTEGEIADLEKMVEAELILSRHHIIPEQRRIYDIKASARHGQMQERKEFAAFLKRVQEARNAQHNG